MKRSHGFTLVEVLVSTLILAVLVTLAAPSVAGLLQSNRVASAVNTFLADLKFARQVAASRNLSVTVCPRDNTADTSMRCAGPATPVNWSAGWIVFENQDAHPDYDSTADQLLLVRDSMADANGVESPSERINFGPMGRSRGGVTRVTFNSLGAAAGQRTVCVGATGRARLVRGSGACD